MRCLLFLLPVVLLAQSSTNQAPASKPVTRSTTSKTAAKPAPAAKPNTETPSPLTTDDEKIIYALGLSISRSISQFDLSPAELTIVERALNDGAAGKPAVELSTWGPKIQEFARNRSVQVAARQKDASNAYLAKAAAEPGAVQSPSGLVYKEIAAGTGPSPKSTDTVKVNYRGTLIDGTEFDSSYSRNQPAQFPLNGVIACWTEGLQKMKVGGKARLVCPASIAYGEQGRPGIPGNAALIFEVELLEIPGSATAAPAPSPTSADH